MTATVEDQALFLIGAAEGGGREGKDDTTVMGSSHQLQGCVVIDMDSFSAISTSACDDREFDRTPKGLQKKGSIGIERKAASGGGGGGESLKEVSALRGGVAVVNEKAIIVVHSTGAALPGTPQARTSSFRRRRASPCWRDPRRVLLLFATLSSMGTIILLYFTLSMGKMDGSDKTNASW